MSLATNLDRHMTYADYLTLPEDEQWELIEGVPCAMSPAPSRIHQKVSGRLFRQLDAFLEQKNCEVYYAPFDVRLQHAEETEDQISTVVQPDLVVVCDPDKLDEKGCLGAPDLVIEIVSPSTASMDNIKKLALYEKYGVREYWIVHPVDQIVMVRYLEEKGGYGKAVIHDATGIIAVRVLPGLMMKLDAVFL
ncbi:MAG: Uma2 family endonuclease [Candidatus Electrothrix sp. Rat3]|nr:Uma2 family endonuclease [Candidatus Electrothrix rattekaaiensis]